MHRLLTQKGERMPERFHSPDDQGLAPAVRDRPPVPALGAVQAAHHVWLGGKDIRPTCGS